MAKSIQHMILMVNIRRQISSSGVKDIVIIFACLYQTMVIVPGLIYLENPQ